MSAAESPTGLLAYSTASAKSRASLRGVQGGPLPPDRSPLSVYPVGCCVLAEIDPGDLAWHLVAFRIGIGVGPPHCRRLSTSPAVPGWNVGMGSAREVRVDLVAYESRWPHRQGVAGQDAESEDPLSQKVVGGSLLLDLTGRSARIADPSPDRAPDQDLVEWISDCGIVASLPFADLSAREEAEIWCPHCPIPPPGRLRCAVRAHRSSRESSSASSRELPRPSRSGAAVRPRPEGVRA